jgi:hypothetical protein
VWTKAANTAAATHAPEPTRSAARGPPAEMIHPVRMLPMGVVPKYTKTQSAMIRPRKALELWSWSVVECPAWDLTIRTCTCKLILA